MTNAAMVLWTAIGFCVFFVGLVTYVIIDAIQMKPKDVIGQIETEGLFEELSDLIDSQSLTSPK